MPDSVTAAARAAFDGRRPRELAVLVYDSLVEQGEPPQKHVLRFEHSRLGIQLHVSAHPEVTTLQGVIDRGGASAAQLHFYDSEVVDTTPIEGVTFEFTSTEHGLARISIETPADRVIWTDWFRM